MSIAGPQNVHQHTEHACFTTKLVQTSLCHSPVGWTIRSNPFLFKKGKNRISFRQSLPFQLTLKIRLKSSLSTLKKWQLSSRRTMEAARGASFTRANLPKSSPSCRVQTTPWGEQDIQIKWIKHPPSSPLPLQTLYLVLCNKIKMAQIFFHRVNTVNEWHSVIIEKMHAQIWNYDFSTWSNNAMVSSIVAMFVTT